MSLFRVSTRGLIPFRLVTDEMETQPDVTDALIEALWSDLDTVTGMTLMPVRRGDADDDGAPVIVALDAGGNIVVLYATARLDSTGLACCLEHTGWARGVTVSGLASDYWRGSDEFWRDWQDFSGTTSPVTVAGTRAPALFVVTTTVTSSTEAALSFLTDVGAPVRVLRAAIYADDHGCQLLELAGGAATGHSTLPTSARRRRGIDSTPPASAAEPNKVAENHRGRQTATPAPKAREVTEGSHGTANSRFIDAPSRAMQGERQVSPGRGIDVGSMNRAAADELFSGSERQQGRFARPTTRASGDVTPQSGSVSQLRRKQSVSDDVVPEADDDLEQMYDEEDVNPAFSRYGERRSKNPHSPMSPPQLAPLRFPAEPVLPEELLGPLGSMAGNGAGNGRGSHSA